MELLLQLWLPIIASAAAVWILAATMWMAMPHHKGDHSQLADEDGVMDALRPMNIPPGNYMFPKCSHKDAQSPEFKAKWERGPAGMLSVWPSTMSMGKPMILSFLVYLAVSFFIAYLGSMALPAGAGFSKVFQVLGTAGVLAYCFGHLPQGIWFQAYPRAMIACIIDGAVFGLTTGAIFAAMWPKG
jgi:hypothetical protein